jgi:predicted RNA binding protein YcfA (HicA-like mRNA interferase family)
MASPVRFGVVLKMMKTKGYLLDHVKGAHHVFKNAQGRHYTIPVHNKRVKGVYVKEIEKL